VYDLTKFTLRDMTLCGAALRTLGEAAQSLEDVASQITHYVYEHLRDPQTGERACARCAFIRRTPSAD
jgi:two-component system, NtrC family, sensor kinase